MKIRIKKTDKKTAFRIRRVARVLDMRAGKARVRRVRSIIQQKAIPSPYIKPAPHFLFKLVAIMLMVSLNGVGLSGVGYTMGYYNDVETSTENTFEAGSVDFLLGVSGWQATSTAVSMPPGDIVKKAVEVDPGDSNPFQYFATSTNFAGDADFCAGLNATVVLEGAPMYDGPLTGLLTDATTTLNSWEITYTTGVQNFQNRICDFDIDYNAWQTRHEYPTYEDGGYSDTEKVPNHLASWGFRINKVYYDVDSPERGADGVNEWVEIYNQTNVPLDISGWKICDNNSCDTLPLTPLIPGQKYAVIVATSTTATTTTVSNGLPAYWYLPSEVTRININEEIGNGLANAGDRLILKRPDDVVIDQMNWGTDTGVWNPGATDVAEGNVLARVPSVYDTDTPSDWQELKPPSVDLIYPDEGGSYTWYWGYSYDIQWTATNNNGSDSDLDISIFYVKDVNYDSLISAGDTTHTIAETTANDGLFNWTVPSGFIGYIWIHLVATGPENPMLNSGTISGKIYDPIPLFIGPASALIFGEAMPETELPAPELPAPDELPAEDIAEPVTEPIEEAPPAVEGAPEETEIVAPESTTEPASEEVVDAPVVAQEVIPEIIPEVVQEVVLEAIVEIPVEEPVIVTEPVVVQEEPPAVVESAPATEPEPAPVVEPPPAE